MGGSRRFSNWGFCCEIINVLRTIDLLFRFFFLCCLISCILPCYGKCLSKWSGAHTTTKNIWKYWTLFIYYTKKKKKKKLYLPNNQDMALANFKPLWVCGIFPSSYHFDSPSPTKKNQQNQTKTLSLTSLSTSPTTAPKCWVKLYTYNFPIINCQPRVGKLVRYYEKYIQTEYCKCS